MNRSVYYAFFSSPLLILHLSFLVDYVFAIPSVSSLSSVYPPLHLVVLSLVSLSSVLLFPTHHLELITYSHKCAMIRPPT